MTQARRSRRARWSRSGLAGAVTAAPPNAADLEAEIVCPVCETTLDQSNAPIAEKMKAFIRTRIAAGDSEQEIKDALVAEFGAGVLAQPPGGGFGLLAWLLPLAALVGGAIAVAFLVRTWSRRRVTEADEDAAPRSAARAPRGRGARPVRRLDAGVDLAFHVYSNPRPRQRWSRSRICFRRYEICGWNMSWTSIPVAFLAGMVSFLAPCVLPLVPAYLSAVSAVDADRLGEPGTARRVVTGSVPFVVGFTAFFVLLGVGAALVGRTDPRRPVPARAHRRVRPRRVRARVHGPLAVARAPRRSRTRCREARGRGSRVLLGGAFAVCAAPCIGPVLAAILVLAGSSDTALQGAALLGVYSLGLAVPFVLAAALFTRAMSAFRWLRDHYRAIQIGGGAIMVALGLLLFFERFYVLRVYLNRFLEWLGLEPAF